MRASVLMATAVCALSIPEAMLADEHSSGGDGKKTLARCIGMQDDQARLACYDHAAGYVRPSRSGSGRWVVSEDVNPVDDTKTVVAVLQAAEGRSEYGRPVELFVRCQSNLIEAFISWGQYLGGDDDKFNRGDQKDLTIRIGDDDAYQGYWGISTDKAATFAPAQIQLLRKMVTAQHLVAQTTPYNSVPITAKFDTTGMADALRPVMETCGYSPLDSTPDLTKRP